ncbi:MAG TPA: hypothetical protein VF204_21895 [Streptosporangiaceae bacterium]
MTVACRRRAAAGSLAGPVAGAVAAVLAMTLAGCSSGGASTPSPAPSPAPPAAAAAASASPSAPSSPPPLTSAQRRKLARLYLAVAEPANKALDHEVDAFDDAQHDDLAKAIAALHGQVRIERSFDRKLGEITFPPPVDVIAHLLVLANRQRIALTLQEAKATSVAGLATFRKRHAAADEAVERQVRLIRELLGLPPPETS